VPFAHRLEKNNCCRMRAVIILLVLLFVGYLVSFIVIKRHREVAFFNQYEQNLLDSHNAFRVDYGLPRLLLDQGLSEAAQRHADQIASEGRLYHSKLSVGRFYAFENIAETGTENTNIVFSAWKRSSGHRRNILARNAECFGVGRSQSFNGRWYWVVILSSKD